MFKAPSFSFFPGFETGRTVVLLAQVPCELAIYPPSPGSRNVTTQKFWTRDKNLAANLDFMAVVRIHAEEFLISITLSWISVLHHPRRSAWVSRGRQTAEEALRNQIRSASGSRLGTDKAGLQLAAGYRQDFARSSNARKQES